MIRKFETADIERVMKIWIDSNLDAHSFIPADYWQTHFSGAEKAISAAEVYVYETEGVIIAFMGIKTVILRAFLLIPSIGHRVSEKNFLIMQRDCIISLR